MADRLPAQRPQSSQDAHDDLLAALAASRELGPEMDKTLAERYLEKHGKPAAQSGGQQLQQPPTSPRLVLASNQTLAAIGPILGIAVYIVLLIVSHGDLWWLFWLPMVLGGGWWWGGGWGHHGGWYGPRDDWRQQRRVARDDYRAWRRGYPSTYPPSQGSDPRRSDDVL